MRHRQHNRCEREAFFTMANLLESESSSTSPVSSKPARTWVKVGVIAAASALAAGLAAAWWHRKTLEKLRQAQENGRNPQFGIAEDDLFDR